MIRSLVLIVLQLFYSKFIVKLQQIPITYIVLSEIYYKIPLVIVKLSVLVIRPPSVILSVHEREATTSPQQSHTDIPSHHQIVTDIRPYKEPI